ncbi:MAG: hypothetical protein IJV50_02080 [Lachnospiraceae bacterium]|nr:hypothetical protein [Lachnospiraceae bacterium]
MALYRRFAIYFYQYQGARKGAFAGFGMVELRDGRMRMQITGRGSYQNAQLEVYGLLDAPGEMAGIHLGTMQSGHFSYEGSLQLHPEKSFQELRGIVLCQKPGADRVAVALWAGNFHTEAFYTWTPKEEQMQTQRGKSIKEAQLETAQLGVCEIQDDVVEAEGKTSPQQASDLDVEEERLIQEERFLDVEEERLIQEERFLDVEEEGLGDDLNVDEKRFDQKENDSSVEDKICNQEDNGLKVENMDENKEKQNTEVENVDVKKEETQGNVENNLENVRMDQEQEAYEQETGEEEYPVDDFWEQMYREFPKMILQVDGEQVSALRIRPCDISRLPKTDWGRGYMQFLARQYNQYRCMILGRQSQKGRWQYFLGLPGSDTPSERKDAADVGFIDFIPIQCPVHRQMKGFWMYNLDFQIR